MGRRRKSSTADDLMDLVALLPWWAGVGLAGLSYWLLHGVATRPLPVVQTGRQISEALPSMLWQGFANGGQYLIPFICLMGALASFLRRRKRRALFDQASQATGADALQGMSWQEFEMLVGEGFKRRGYGVRETGGGGADGGVDLVLTKGSEKFFVQCKQWKAFKVGVTTVRELYGVMAAGAATGGFVVTSGRFTKEAEAFAAGRNVELVDGPALAALLRAARTAGAGRPGASAAPRAETGTPRPATDARQHTARGTSAGTDAAPACPRCDRPMVRRTARKGSAAGKTFWGCSGYSQGCRGTREIAAP
ncbi:restriction endonuclease [Pseudorhodoferax sp. Leaf267]|uniref:restriction endonuclease n=1 Tax=Pseudorhodoferax sp. Leaf267 TaxID=1736316 RepID=UPI0006F66A17|nr:restriction endonuclease [Pseudorhodoferax sp. Leaf267]KQP22814.1 restriction endonuclease [Pseudorhodoferax sp. Leaf267]